MASLPQNIPVGLQDPTKISEFVLAQLLMGALPPPVAQSFNPIRQPPPAPPQTQLLNNSNANILDQLR